MSIPAPTIVPWQNGLSTHPIYLWRSNSAFILVGWILDSKFKYMWWCWLVVYTKSWKIIRNFTHLNQETITDLHCLSEKGAKSRQHDYVIVTMLFYLQNTSSGFKGYKRFTLFVEQNWLSVNAIHYRVILWSHERRYGSIAYFSHKSISIQEIKWFIMNQMLKICKSRLTLLSLFSKIIYHWLLLNIYCFFFASRSHSFSLNSTLWGMP